MDIPRNIQETTHDLTNRIAPQIDAVRERLDGFTERAATYIRRNPTQSLVGAIVVGYLLGRIISRR
ncbi:MAG TPA: hypothetical protein VHF22_09085 [Planctomycetota bacterium]|nr:hypothetical protein [Planctomycetota bacterium]